MCIRDRSNTTPKPIPELSNNQEKKDNNTSNKTQKPDDIPKTNPSLFDVPSSKPLFGNPTKGGLFDKLSKENPSGLFASLGNKSSSNNLSGGLFSKLQTPNPEMFFKSNNNPDPEDEDDENEDQKREDSVDESKVKYLVTFESSYNTLISKNVRNFKTQAVGGPVPDGGFGNGTVTVSYTHLTLPTTPYV